MNGTEFFKRLSDSLIINSPGLHINFIFDSNAGSELQFPMHFRGAINLGGDKKKGHQLAAFF
jgi:hypothetical protein